MNYEELASIIRIYNHLPSHDEETIKISVVVPFLKFLGYKPEWMHFEYPTYDNKRRVDVSIYIDNDCEKKFFIEVKKDICELNQANFTQLANYLNDQKISWGILTNGLCYILINNEIRGKSDEKEVFHFYLQTPPNYVTSEPKYSKTRNANNLKYFSYDYLFKTGVTNYFKYLTDLKITIKNDRSIKQYESALYNFFDYLSELDLPFETENIRPIQFKKFLLNEFQQDKIKKLKSPVTIINKYRYINKLCEMLKSRKVIPSNPFEHITESQMIDGFNFEVSTENPVPLTHEEVSMLFSIIDNNRNCLRNKLIFLLFLYAGLDIQQIANLKVSEINIEKQTIKIENTIIPIPSKITAVLNEYLSYRKQEKIKCIYLICGKYYGQYDRLDDTSYNRIISEQFNLINVDEKRKKQLTPSFIKSSVLNGLFKNGIHIEELVKLTGLSLSAIGAYLDDDTINNRVKLDRIIKKHPYREFLEL